MGHMVAASNDSTAGLCSSSGKLHVGAVLGTERSVEALTVVEPRPVGDDVHSTTQWLITTQNNSVGYTLYTLDSVQ